MALKWFGNAYINEVEFHIGRQLDKAAIHLVNKIKKKLSVPGTASAIRSFTYKYGGETFNVRKKGRVYGAVHSEPGEPPRKQTGRLRASITWDQSGKHSRRVGSNVIYARRLEVELDRPYLRSTLAEESGRIAEIIGKPMKGGPATDVFIDGDDIG